MNESKLTHLANQVDKLEATYIEVGQALMAIQDLFRKDGQTSDDFEGWAWKRWGWPRASLYRRIRASKIACQVSKLRPAPANRSIALVLGELEDDKITEAWDRICRKNEGKHHITAEMAKDVVTQMQIQDPGGVLQVLAAKELADMDDDEAVAVLEANKTRNVRQMPKKDIGTADEKILGWLRKSVKLNASAKGRDHQEALADILESAIELIVDSYTRPPTAAAA